jgi:PEP-CTERM motif
MLVRDVPTQYCSNHHPSHPLGRRRSVAIGSLRKWVPLLLLTMGAIASTAESASITYSVVNYPALQNGFTVSGTITTNGATGSSLPGIDITSWDINIAFQSTLTTLTPSNTFNQTGTFDATNSELTITGADSIVFIGVPGSIQWVGISNFGVYDGNVLGESTMWNSVFPLGSSVATVPEPSSLILAMIGGGIALACVVVRHHRGKSLPATGQATCRPTAPRTLLFPTGPPRPPGRIVLKPFFFGDHYAVKIPGV